MPLHMALYRDDERERTLVREAREALERFGGADAPRPNPELATLPTVFHTVAPAVLPAPFLARVKGRDAVDHVEILGGVVPFVSAAASVASGRSAGRICEGPRRSVRRGIKFAFAVAARAREARVAVKRRGGLDVARPHLAPPRLAVLDAPASRLALALGQAELETRRARDPVMTRGVVAGVRAAAHAAAAAVHRRETLRMCWRWRGRLRGSLRPWRGPRDAAAGVVEEGQAPGVGPVAPKGAGRRPILIRPSRVGDGARRGRRAGAPRRFALVVGPALPRVAAERESVEDAHGRARVLAPAALRGVGHARGLPNERRAAVHPTVGRALVLAK
mmetsp:Transcript_63259/g.193515  ORF Transcript_63259/g.193515 Transcript_63259/m.193515 type:complete len:333 (-) Transcript_63259:899-1897(-)